MREFNIHVGSGVTRVVADFITIDADRHTIRFWVKQGWWRKRCVGLADYRYVIVVRSAPLKSDAEHMAEMGIKA